MSAAPASTDLRMRLFRLGARSLPKLLTLQDRNPHSPTYGCFDRAHWHLRVKDFPSGMAQEFVLPLALAWANDFPGNTLHGAPAVREWARAGIAYAAASAHADGACDDYYPFEKAAGAAAFSLYAVLGALQAAEIDADPFLPFIRKRAGWLADHHESGRLSNHEALIANCLFGVARLTGDEAYARAGKARLDRLMTWQSGEGWFFEYQGCDPGYLTLTIANLAEIDRAQPDLGLRPAIERAVRFLHAIQPPDGWLGGEWTSRNTNNYFPHGFEVCGAWLPEALEVNTRAVAALADPPEYDDDNIIGHHCWSYLKAALAWRDDRPDAGGEGDAFDFPEAGLVGRRAGDLTLLAATKKGGAFRLYEGHRLLRADTGVSLQVREGGKVRTWVCHLWADDNEVAPRADGVRVAGRMGRAMTSRMTPMKNVVLRVLMLTFGRFNPDLVRRMLQKLLITGKAEGALRFERDLALAADGLTVTDRITGPGVIVAAGVGPAQTSIYTVMSRVFHRPQLQPWEDLGAEVRPGDGVRLDIERHFRPAERAGP